MTFVRTRPEVPRYVKQYTKEMYATLLLPVGVTSEASIEFKDEDEMLGMAEDVDETYIGKVLPKKTQYNLMSLKNFSVATEFHTMIKPFLTVIK